MKRIVVFALALLALGATAMAQGRIEHFTMKSHVLGVEKPYSVYLPEGYDNSTERYPVLYLLHGAKGSHESWCREGRHALPDLADVEIAAARAKRMIIVMPDASGKGEKRAGKDMGYFNVAGWPYETYFFDEFIPYIDKKFRTIAEKRGRAVAGLSMGGGGAFVYAQRHPDLFIAAYSTSGLLDHRYRPAVPEYYDAGWLMSVAQTSPVEYLRNATAEQVEKLRTVRWMLDCGDDDGLINTNFDFVTEMHRAKVPVEFRVRDGVHDWKFWLESLPLILRFSFPEE